MLLHFRRKNGGFLPQFLHPVLHCLNLRLAFCRDGFFAPLLRRRNGLIHGARFDQHPLHALFIHAAGTRFFIKHYGGQIRPRRGACFRRTSSISRRPHFAISIFDSSVVITLSFLWSIYFVVQNFLLVRMDHSEAHGNRG